MGKEYPVGTIEQMAAIPAEARPRFLAEFPELLRDVSMVIETHKVLNDVLGEDVAKLGTPVWIDDDKGQKTYTVSDAESGEEVFSATMKLRGDKA